jgi:hypothetical protein
MIKGLNFCEGFKETGEAILASLIAILRSSTKSTFVKRLDGVIAINNEDLKSKTCPLMYVSFFHTKILITQAGKRKNILSNILRYGICKKL